MPNSGGRVQSVQSNSKEPLNWRWERGFLKVNGGPVISKRGNGCMFSKNFYF